MQQPHPPIYMSGSSPESGEFAARNRIGLGFAVTTLPLAAKAAAHYREQADKAGWTPTPDDIVFRVTFHVGDSDEAAAEEVEASRAPDGSLSLAIPRAADEAIADAGYYGRDEAQKTRVMAAFGGDLAYKIDVGAQILGGPKTVIEQIRRIREEVGAGVLDLIPGPVGGEGALEFIARFGREVLPAIREL